MYQPPLDEWPRDLAERSLPAIRKLRAVKSARLVGDSIIVQTKSMKLSNPGNWFPLASIKIALPRYKSYPTYRYTTPLSKFLHPIMNMTGRNRIGAIKFSRGCIGGYAHEYIEAFGHGPVEATTHQLAMLQGITHEHKETIRGVRLFEGIGLLIVIMVIYFTVINV